MDHLRSSGKIDPDYESYNSALELNEEEDKRENLVKIKKIIEDEYSKEISQRQEQIEQIELQICKVRKLLHLLRYALIMSYYKKQELEYNGGEEEASSSDIMLAPDKQNRIHPAVKKLLGRNINNLDHLNIKDKRKTSARRDSISHTLTDLGNSPESKKIKLDEDAKIRTEASSVNKENLEFIRSRKKTKHRLIIGNISKWMPSSEDDILTHKWMVYIRGPKDKPSVSHFVEKVVYYLHPSYKPHDVVEVCESPFHLSRRGWGEFPVRVQIYFKVSLNKPIDVVHNIKLDKTYSGRQTLGNETVIDVFLYDDKTATTSDKEVEISENSQDIDLQAESCDIKIEPCDIKMEVAELDYCLENVEQEPELDFDHAYCLPEGCPKPQKEIIEQDSNNKLIYGLDSYYNGETTNEKKTLFSNNVKQLVVLNRKDIKFSNTKIIVFGKKLEGAFLTTFGKLQTNKTEPNLKVTLPKNRFKNMGEALPYLFKKLPLFSVEASNSNYKRLYPFTASSLKEFVSWNVGKRRSSEWSRARAIKKILTSESVEGFEKWNTKAILMFGRSHDYTPFISYGLFIRDSKEKDLLMSCYANSSELKQSDFFKNAAEEEQDVTVNVDSDTDSPKKSQTVIDITDSSSKLECSFIRQTAQDCGVMFKAEEIIDGVKVNGAELMILEAVKCLAENLIRRAKNHRVCMKTLSPNTSAINREDVEVAISERPELFCLRRERRNEYFL